MLDRASGEAKSEGDGEKKEHWTNEYLSSFKVAQYTTREADEEEPDEEVIFNITDGGVMMLFSNTWLYLFQG